MASICKDIEMSSCECKEHNPFQGFYFGYVKDIDGSKIVVKYRYPFHLNGCSPFDID